MNSIEIYPRRRIEANSVELIVLHDGAYLENMTFTVPEPGAVIPSGAMISETEAQAFMDRLWACGFRPSEGSGSAGSLAATEHHLEDMRRIAFSLMEVEKP